MENEINMGMEYENKEYSYCFDNEFSFNFSDFIRYMGGIYDRKET